MLKKAFVELWEYILKNAAGIGIVLGFLLWRNRIYKTYFDPMDQDTIRPAAGLLMFAFASNFVAKIAWTFFRLLRMTLQTNRFTNSLFNGPGRIVPRLIGTFIQLIAGIWLAACIMDSWKRLTKASECLPGRSCCRLPLWLILEAKYLVCPHLSNVGNSFYPELMCEMIFDLMPFFLIVISTVIVTVLISILQKRTQERFVIWKNFQERARASSNKKVE